MLYHAFNKECVNKSVVPKKSTMHGLDQEIECIIRRWIEKSWPMRLKQHIEGLSNAWSKKTINPLMWGINLKVPHN